MAEEIKKASVFPNDPYGRLNGQGTYFKTSPAGNVYMTDVDRNNVPTGFRSEYYYNDRNGSGRGISGNGLSGSGISSGTGSGAGSGGGNWSDTIIKGLETAYNANVGKIGADRDKALQDAYTTYMMDIKDLQQKNAAQGVTGGMTNTEAAQRAAAYQGGRNDLYSNAEAAIADLGVGYQQNVADAMADYQKTIADQNFQKELEQFKYNLEHPSYSLSSSYRNGR